MLALIMAVLIGFGGSGGADNELVHVFFDGDVPLVSSVPGGYFVIMVHKNSISKDPIWTSGNIPAGGHYLSPELYTGSGPVNNDEPFMVECWECVDGRLHHRVGMVSGLLWVEDFTRDPGTLNYYCTNDF